MKYQMEKVTSSSNVCNDDFCRGISALCYRKLMKLETKHTHTKPQMKDGEVTKAVGSVWDGGVERCSIHHAMNSILQSSGLQQKEEIVKK